MKLSRHHLVVGQSLGAAALQSPGPRDPPARGARRQQRRQQRPRRQLRRQWWWRWRRRRGRRRRRVRCELLVAAAWLPASPCARGARAGAARAHRGRLRPRDSLQDAPGRRVASAARVRRPVPPPERGDAARRLPCVDTLASTRRLRGTLASLLRIARAQGSSLAQGSALAACVPGPVISRAPPALGTTGWYRAAGHAYNCSAAASVAQQGGTAPAIGLGGGGRCDAGALGLLDLLLAAQPVLAVLAQYPHPLGSTPQALGRSSHPVHTLEDPRSHAACMIRRERRVRCREAVPKSPIASAFDHAGRRRSELRRDRRAHAVALGLPRMDRAAT